MWHLGCVLAAAWSKTGFKVVGFDYSQGVVEKLNQGQPPIFEPHLEETIKNAEEARTLSFASDIKELADCDFVFLAYDTVVLENDESDISLLEKAVNDLSLLRDGAIVIVSSQTPVGTCRKFRAQLQKRNSSLELVYSPENLRLGEAIECYLNPGRVILGGEATGAISRIFSLFKNINAELLTMNLESAEMVKHGINAFLASSIVFGNQLADICEAVGANAIDVVRGMRSDPRIGTKAPLLPGLGFSGGTLGRDLQILAKLETSLAKKSSLFESILKLNQGRTAVILDRIAELLDGAVRGKIIAVLGLTYKPGTSTLRRSLPLEIAVALYEKGATIKAFDPKANYKEFAQKVSFTIASSIDEALKDSDLVLLLTEWNDFREYDWGNKVSLAKGKKLFDTKNFLYDLRLRDRGYEYFGVGIPGA